LRSVPSDLLRQQHPRHSTTTLAIAKARVRAGGSVRAKTRARDGASARATGKARARVIARAIARSGARPRAETDATARPNSEPEVADSLN